MTHDDTSAPPLQPLLHDATVVLAAPTQVWSAASGELGAAPVHGLYHSNTRVLRAVALTVDGIAPEHIGTDERDASHVVFTALLRGRGEPTADPRVRIDRERVVSAGRMAERIVISSALDDELLLEVTVSLEADFTPIHLVKSGLEREKPLGEPHITADGATWRDGPVSLRVHGSGARAEAAGGRLQLRWSLRVPAHGASELDWTADADDEEAVIAAAADAPGWTADAVPVHDQRLRRWLDRAFADLAGLRMTRGDSDTFLAAGAPWFFTLFGRDALWSARFLLPVDVSLAMSTLRTLARLQGSKVDPLTAEQPGKIMHELRPTALALPHEGVTLPPLYYGTIDATPLWISLLRDAWRAGAPMGEVRALLPSLTAALAWMRDHGLGEDGFLSYADESGQGLSNQGWKDSGDSIQWRDGRLAEGPIALVEVQGYAYEAALAGAELLDTFEQPGAAEWRAWAAALRGRFSERFWIEDERGAYPAVALDAHGERVDSVASNMGHLLGTGILEAGQARLIAERLLSPELSSGFGLRTLSTDAAGFWPLSYHGGSVWAHDTAIAVAGLAREGFHAEAGTLADGLIAAAEHFGYRMPELHSGDARGDTSVPAPYPAACRPQAWSAAAAVAIAAALA